MKGNELDTTPVADVLREARAIAQGIVESYLPTVSVADENAMLYLPLGVSQAYHYEEIDGNRWGKLVLDESNVDAQRRVPARLLQILDGALANPPVMPTGSSLHGADTKLSEKYFLQNVARQFKRARISPLLDQVFAYGTIDKSELEMLVDCLNGAAETANEMLAGDVKLSAEHTSVLRMWREQFGPDAPLQFMQVAELFCKHRKVVKLPSQCSEPGAFLYRFATKSGKPGGRAPWILRESAKTRKL